MLNPMFQNLINFIREQYKSKDNIPLHEPVFLGREREYLNETINSTFVSSIGKFVNKFEENIVSYTKSPYAVGTINGTSALHIALKLAGVKPGELVITQPLTFVATCNAISYCQAEPVFLDVSKNTLSLCPKAVENWLHDNARLDNDNICRTKKDNKVVKVCLPMHTFGIPADLDGLIDVCKRWKLILVEDAAESLGSFYKGVHTGTFGMLGILSFNGNKILTTGSGGIILSDRKIGIRARHLTSTAKINHKYEYFHDELGYNYRLPNINAALGCAQLEQLENFILKKRELASRYNTFFKNSELEFINEPQNCRSNCWLNAVICKSIEQRNSLLEFTNNKGVMTRPIWTLMNKLPMYQHCRKDSLENSIWLESRVVNLPSSVIVD